ncbi:abortive infection family protein [Selenomonas caprae]|uniref:Abortive infection family protein n=2 Tax=Selenomonas caprae TaxID=2606905 RepID=A0A5D6WMV4_9FIRM|nr:abortive infection family protein [Selenomonas caprae]
MEVTTMQAEYTLLNRRTIIDIFIGDEKLGKHVLSNGNTLDISMPYLSGPQICTLAQELGCPLEYAWNGGGMSRWQYFKTVLEYCIDHQKCVLLLTRLFQRGQFTKILEECTIDEVDNVYELCVNRVLKIINDELRLGGNALQFVNGRCELHPIHEDVPVYVPLIKTISYEEIANLSEQAMKCIERGDFQSALTKSRTILEDTFAYVIRQKGEEPGNKGDIKNLYMQVKDLYGMHADKDMDRRINVLLSGLEKIVDGIRDMRNEYGDAHGKGLPKLKVERHHARLCVNSATAMAEFILSVYMKATKRNV